MLRFKLIPLIFSGMTSTLLERNIILICYRGDAQFFSIATGTNVIGALSCLFLFWRSMMAACTGDSVSEGKNGAAEESEINLLQREIDQIKSASVMAEHARDFEKQNALADTLKMAVERFEQLRIGPRSFRFNLRLVLSSSWEALLRFSSIPRCLDFVGYLFPRRFRRYEWRLSVTDFKLDYSEARQKYRSPVLRACLVGLFGYKATKLFFSAQAVLWWSRAITALESAVQVFRK